MATKSEITVTPPWYQTVLAKSIMGLIGAALVTAAGTRLADPAVAPVAATVAPQAAPLPPVQPPAVLEERINTQAATVQRIEQKVDSVADDVNSIKVSLARMQGTQVGQTVVPVNGTTGPTLTSARRVR